MAMLLGAACLLRDSAPLPASVRLIFQPAEEIGAGARAMVDTGVLDGIGAIFGGHVDGHFPTGMIVAARGTVNASSDSFRITIRGRQGHAARPHETVDAVVVGGLIVMALQTIVAREIDPTHPSVVTVGSFHAGSAANVIAGGAVLEGTIRARDAGVREHLRRSVRRICDSTAQLHQANIEVELTDGTPMLVNRGPMTVVAQEAAEAVVGPKRVRRAMRAANMGGEDFAWYLQRAPGCYVRFGIRPPRSLGVSAHSSRFDIDEAVLATGAAWFAEVAMRAGRLLASGGRAGGRG
jgi:hippurate hydrolase